MFPISENVEDCFPDLPISRRPCSLCRVIVAGRHTQATTGNRWAKKQGPNYSWTVTLWVHLTLETSSLWSGSRFVSESAAVHAFLKHFSILIKLRQNSHRTLKTVLFVQWYNTAVCTVLPLLLTRF